MVWSKDFAVLEGSKIFVAHENGYSIFNIDVKKQSCERLDCKDADQADYAFDDLKKITKLTPSVFLFHFKKFGESESFKPSCQLACRELTENGLKKIELQGKTDEVFVQKSGVAIFYDTEKCIWKIIDPGRKQAFDTEFAAGKSFKGRAFMCPYFENTLLCTDYKSQSSELLVVPDHVYANKVLELTDSALKETDLHISGMRNLVKEYIGYVADQPLRIASWPLDRDSNGLRIQSIRYYRDKNSVDIQDRSILSDIQMFLSAPIVEMNQVVSLDELKHEMQKQLEYLTGLASRLKKDVSAQETCRSNAINKIITLMKAVLKKIDAQENPADELEKIFKELSKNKKLASTHNDIDYFKRYIQLSNFKAFFEKAIELTSKLSLEHKRAKFV